jgi:hypothetical protein
MHARPRRSMPISATPRGHASKSSCPRVPVLDTRRRAVFLAHHVQQSAVLHRARAETRAKHASNGGQLAHAWCLTGPGWDPSDRGGVVWRTIRAEQRAAGRQIVASACPSVQTWSYSTCSSGRCQNISYFSLIAAMGKNRHANNSPALLLTTSLKHQSILCYYPHGGFQAPASSRWW